MSKNHPGGLSGRRVMPKIVTHHANVDCPERCFVRLFKKYHQLCPPDAPPHAFYLQPCHQPTSTCWFSKRPLGHTTLGKTVGRICKSAGITGYKTNHSLHATTTTRLYQSGVDEQLVMERTGHRSLDGVRSYKRTSDCQRLALSDILNKEISSHQPTVTTCPVVPLVQSALSNQLLQGLSIPSATFSHCEVHFHVGSTGTDVKMAEPPRKRRRAWILDDSDSD